MRTVWSRCVKCGEYIMWRIGTLLLGAHHCGKRVDDLYWTSDGFTWIKYKQAQPMEDTEPTPTCPDHPGDYGTNCKACEQDLRRYRAWKVSTQEDNSKESCQERPASDT